MATLATVRQRPPLSITKTLNQQMMDFTNTDNCSESESESRKYHDTGTTSNSFAAEYEDEDDAT